jgi:hypothetical protein
MSVPDKKATIEDQNQTELELLNANASRITADNSETILPPDPVTRKGFGDIFKEMVFGVDNSDRTSTVGDEAGMLAGEQTYVGPSQDSKDFIRDAINAQKVTGNNNLGDNTNSVIETGNSNNNGVTLTSGGILSAPPSFSLEQMNSKFAGEKADALSKADDSFKTKKSNTPTLMKQNNEISSSRKRGGLFGNYGKQVEIKKTFNKSTGRTNKQKFVDGELFSDRNSRQDVRRAGRNAASNKRTNKKANRNK